MAVCNECGGHLAKINGRTLKEALAFTKAVFHRNKLSNTHWVNVCPACDAYVLGAETAHPWPFQSPDGVMRVVDDYDQGCVAVGCETLELCGFKFSEAAVRSANVLLGVEAQSIQLEAQGASLNKNSSPDKFLQFSRGVCEWGRGQRVWGNLLRHHESENLSHLLKHWLIYAGSSCEDEKAIARGADIKGLGVSFASKHLRMLNPERYAVLDDVFQQGLGIALNPRGYRLFMSKLRTLNDELKPPLRIANLESAIFLLVRQDVRAKAEA
ncbi:hypothetical protein [Vreelandella alkaliphila]|uniref:hypothetical protein n=1 Tax=Vreelandella alkaliphila TaxID=272774 RepID=UPI003FD80422